jgi:hypothetical protein
MSSLLGTDTTLDINTVLRYSVAMSLSVKDSYSKLMDNGPRG